MFLASSFVQGLLAGGAPRVGKRRVDLVEDLLVGEEGQYNPFGLGFQQSKKL